MRVVFHLGYPRTGSRYLPSGKKGQSFCVTIPPRGQFNYNNED